MIKGTDNYAEAFGNRLKIAITKAGKTQAELADATGLAKDTLSRYERGSIAPGAEAVLRLANACRVNPLWLLSGQSGSTGDTLDNAALNQALSDLTDALNAARDAHGLPTLEKDENDG